MADFRARGTYETMVLAKASGTVIEAGDLVALTSGLAVKAGATSSAIAFCANGAVSADLTCEVSRGHVQLIGDGANVFAVAQRGLAYDISISSTKQLLNTSGATYKVLMVDPSQDAGVVGSADDIKVEICRPLEERLTTVI